MDGNTLARIIVVMSCVSAGLLGGAVLVTYVDSNATDLLWKIGLSALGSFVTLGVVLYMFRKGKTLKVSGSAAQGSEVGFVIGTFQDLVGKLKAKERELEQLKTSAEEKALRIETYNENVLQSVPSGVISIDNAGKIRSMNEAAERMLGVQISEVMEKDYCHVLKEPFITLAEGERDVSRVEYPYVTDDMRQLWLGITMSQLRNKAGEGIGYIFVFTDLTDVKSLQAQIELKERLSQLGEMSAGISHELRNSMSVISGYAKLLSRRVEESGRATVDSIIAEIRTMDQIISELLAFARPSVLNKDVVDLEDLLRETIDTSLGGNNSVIVNVHVDGDSSCEADRVLLRQALTNLFTNAAEAMPGGGAVTVTLRSLHNNMEIRICDSGTGIPDSIRQKIFLPFYTTKEQGIGFGLALVQKIIVSHGGSIEASGNGDGGACFQISLPRGTLVRV